jgi:sodium pump decarboxylase gamma subunit
MENMAFGLNITLIGMSLVFALLALLWLVLTLIGKIDSLPFMKRGEAAAAPAEEEPAESYVVTESRSDEIDPDMMAAITVAIAAHVAMRRRQGAPSMRMTVPGSQIFASRWVAAGRARQTGSWAKRG